VSLGEEVSEFSRALFVEQLYDLAQLVEERGGDVLNGLNDLALHYGYDDGLRVIGGSIDKDILDGPFELPHQQCLGVLAADVLSTSLSVGEGGFL
jgi:hypothetical protein